MLQYAGSLRAYGIHMQVMASITDTQAAECGDQLAVLKAASASASCVWCCDLCPALVDVSVIATVPN